MLKYIKLLNQTYISIEKVRLALAIFWNFIGIATDIAIGLLISFLFNINESFQFLFIDFRSIQVISGLLVLCAGIRIFSKYSEEKYARAIHLGIDKQLKDTSAEKLFSKQNVSVPDTFFKINKESEMIGESIYIVLKYINGLIQFVLFSAALIYINALGYLSLVAFSSLVLYPLKRSNELLKVSNTEYKDSVMDINEAAENITSNFYLIKILQTTRLEIEKFLSISNKYLKSFLRNYILSVTAYHLPQTLALMFLGVSFIIFPSVRILEHVTFIIVAIRLVQALGQIIQYRLYFGRFTSYLDDFLNEATNDDFTPENYKDLNSVNGELSKDNIVELKEITFKYSGSGEELFNNLSTSIKAGSHTTIVGPNGSGKSTLLGIIGGIYLPVEGSVLRGYKTVGYVGAKPLILKASIRENLLYGVKEKISDEKLLEVLDYFKVFPIIEKETLNKEISNQSLSSGQMQKISFCRIEIQNPELLLLDESTSNLDVESLSKVVEYLDSKNFTIVNVTHNPLAFSGVDVRLEMIENNVVEV